MSDNTDLINRYLPKWPQMIVSGVSVTPEQAKEIIRRTDNFFTSGYGGNDHEYDFGVKILLGMPVYQRNDGYCRNRETARKYGIDLPVQPEKYMEVIEAEIKWREEWGCLHTNYVRNAWVSSSFIFGPHGWCHPDGQIGYIDNVGKWPSVEEILEDWKLLAAAFPFLDIAVTLMDGEESENGKNPVVGIRVENGEAVLVEPEVTTEYHLRGHKDIPHIDRGEHRFGEIFGNPRHREHGLPGEWFLEWAEKFGPQSKGAPLLEQATRLLGG